MIRGRDRTVDDIREVENLAATILRHYFCESDVDFLISTFTDDIVWLGAGKDQKAEGREAVSRWFGNVRNELMPCRMWDEEYVVTRLGDDCWLCEGVSELESVEPGALLRVRQRVTFVFKRIDGLLKTAHIHHSVPFEALRPGEAFPYEVARENYYQLQRLLSEKEQQIELMLHQLPGGMMVCYPDEKFTTKWISDGLCRMLGYESAAAYRAAVNSCAGFIHPDDFVEMRDRVSASLASGDSYSGEYRIVRPDGGVRWVLDLGKRFTDVDNETVVSCFITDITERVEREVALEKANRNISRQAAFLSQLYNTVPCGIVQISTDSAHRVINANRSAWEIYGYTEEEYCRQLNDPFVTVSDGDSEWIHRTVDELGRHGGSVFYEREALKKDGASCWVSVMMERLINHDGIEVIQVVFSDISEIKRLQKEQEQERLIENRSLRTAIYTAYQLIVRANLTQDTYEALNERDYIDEIDPYGHYSDQLRKTAEGLHPSYRDDFIHTFSADSLERRFASGEQEVYMECQRMGRDRVYHWLSVTCIQVENPYSDEVLCILLLKVLDDQRTEKMLQEQVLRNALASAKAANQAKSDFFSRMSHDIRTPMNAIIGMSAIGQLKMNEPERVRECFSKIDVSSRYLLSLINDILDMSKIESGKMILTNARFDFSGLISQINTIIYPQALENRLSCRIHHVGVLERFYIGDALRINQILMNLLSNALKFTPAGGKIDLDIGESRRANGFAYVQFRISDTGIGMSPEFMKRLYVPFEQETTDIARNKIGSGLGLSIVHSMVQLMGGTIEVQSEKNRGTVFTVTLPLKLVTGDQEAENRGESRELLGGRQVLVADGDRLAAEQTSRLLADIGAKAFRVDSGFKAIEAVKMAAEKGGRYDVALIGHDMPDMDGIETARAIRKLVGPDTTLAVMTAGNWTAIGDEAREAGADHVITKPLSLSSLCDVFMKPGKRTARKTVSDIQFAGRRFLLVEDNELNMEIARSLMELHGMQVDPAENGQVAVEKFQASPEGHYSAILMDIRMPVLDGMDATRVIRALPRRDAATVPVIAMSANAFDEDRKMALDAGINDYLVKPVEMADLLAVLGKWVWKAAAV
ncbi:PAS domain S-box protein [Oxalobacter formigenes HOxBLS]|uniref:Virulence sensor protein BvgS n=1 Tax=Oxalobacter paraformigenes TaxID=556268 RepID=C3X315_9BURK|nr:PAS domain S-box protein [Oxalobacter paraformigenes]